MNLGANASANCLCQTGIDAFQLGTGEAYFKGRFRQIQLSDGVTANFAHRAGFMDAAVGGNDPTDGVFFRYTHSVNGGRFQAVARSNGTETAADTGVTVAINTTYALEVSINAAGTSAEFRIDGVLVATIATNLPVGASRIMGAGCFVRRSVGATNVGAVITWDYFLVTVTPNYSR